MPTNVRNMRARPDADPFAHFATRTALSIQGNPGMALMVAVIALVLSVVAIYEVYRFRTADQRRSAELAAVKDADHFEKMAQKYDGKDFQALVLYRYLQFVLHEDIKGTPPGPDYKKTAEILDRLKNDHGEHPLTLALIGDKSTDLYESVKASANFDSTYRLQRKLEEERKAAEKKAREEKKKTPESAPSENKDGK